MPEHTQRTFDGPLEGVRNVGTGHRGIAHRTFAASSEIETGLSQVNDPKQGARLVRAFLRITDPRVRLAIVQIVEEQLGLLPRIVIVRVTRVDGEERFADPPQPSRRGSSLIAATIAPPPTSTQV